MRISILASDPGYWQRPFKVHALYAEITLDGERLTDCVTADEEQGLVVVYQRGENGMIKHDGVEWLSEERRGVVKIIPTRMPNGRWPHPGVPEPVS